MSASAPYYSDSGVTLHHGDCLEVMAAMPDASVDAVVTDPPYGLGFMGRKWDDLPPGEPWARECLRVLKPGGHMLAFGGSRTWHRLAVAVEDAGFDIRDSIAWLYGSGFPKSKNLDGEWQGWGTALKPAFEPIVVARKPLAGTVAANVFEHGTGALNIDGCRVEGEPWTFTHTDKTGRTAGILGESRAREGVAQSHPAGRWPTNVALDESQAAELDRQSGETSYNPKGEFGRPGAYNYDQSSQVPSDQPFGYGDRGGASRFFPTFKYQAKAPTKERPKVKGVAHPTVKPLALMQWLVRLVTPPGGVVLDPFAGSGTTVEACALERFQCIAIEREADYLPLIMQRLSRSTELGLDLEGLRA